MHVLVTGAAGMLGRKLVESFARDGGPDGHPIDALTLIDVVAPQAPAGVAGRVVSRAVDMATPGEAEAMIEGRPDLVVHLAAIVSGEAEADFDKGYRVNLDATRALFEAIRAGNLAFGYRPRVVFASSIAVFGAPFPERIGDEFVLTPLTSYGTQKAIDELLLSDYSRRGFFDGIGLRLPTICVRPGKPNKAASGFFSSIIREPLIGQEAVLPVSEDVRHWHASPRSAVAFLRHAAAIDLAALGSRRNLTMPGCSATVGDQIAALERIAGRKATALIRREPDPTIARIVSGWPSDFDAGRALALGFRAETSFDAIVRAHVEDELGGKDPHS
jgi:nucleoside-diphosphate-sugar epimerase